MTSAGIVLPKELRQTMGIRTGDPMEIYTDADNIILRKYAPGCGVLWERGRSPTYPRCADVRYLREQHADAVPHGRGERRQMKVFGDPRAKAKVRRYIMWGIEDGIVCASFIAGIALAGWLFHILFAALGVA